MYSPSPIEVLWQYIIQNSTLSALILMLGTLMIKLLLLSFYFGPVYYGIMYYKKHRYRKMSARANCYCWFFLLGSVVLANLNFNNFFLSLSYRFLNSTIVYTAYSYLTGCLLLAVWIFIVVFKLLAFTLMNCKIKKSMKQMERYDDHEGSVDLIATELGLRKKPMVLLASYIETPVSYGIFTKVILLPFNFKEKYTECECYLLLLHESTHIKNGDTIKLYILSIAECFLWLTPAMRSFRKNFKRDFEILCDSRVMALQDCDRDTYGNLMIKECACKSTSFGFGFSDSYHALENRLDALYRYKGKTEDRKKLFFIIPAAILIICVLSYTLRSDWFVVNEQYNLEFEVSILDNATGDYVLLPQEDGIRVLEFNESLFEAYVGEISVNETALRELAEPIVKGGPISVHISSANYVVYTGETITPTGFDNRLNYAAKKVEDDEDVGFTVTAGLPVKQRTFVEYLFLLITSKL